MSDTISEMNGLPEVITTGGQWPPVDASDA